MSTVLEINPSDIPVRLKFVIKSVTWEFLIKEFKYDNTIRVDLFEENNTIPVIENEKMITGMPLFSHFLEDSNGNGNPNFPDAYLIPISTDGSEPSINNLGKTVFLTEYERTGNIFSQGDLYAT